MMETTDEIIASARRHLFGPGVSSADRAGVMCKLVVANPPEVFWPVFQDTWLSCDDTWEWSRAIVHMLRQNGSAAFGNTGRAREFMDAENAAFFDDLPDIVAIFRGCSRDRVRAVSWSTDRSVAEKFAHGHRWIRVPNPVIACAVVPKEAIFTVFTDRNESELIVDPRRLRKLTVRDYVFEKEA